MSVSDPIADMLTRVRNALRARLEVVEVPHSRMKTEVARIMKREGYLADFSVEKAGVAKTIRIYPKYWCDAPVIRGMRRVSSPGQRRFVTVAELPRVLGGMGMLWALKLVHGS